MNSKSKDIQNLHSSLGEAMVTKERLEQKVAELMEMSHNMPNDALEARVQVSQSTSSAVETRSSSFALRVPLYFALFHRNF